MSEPGNGAMLIRLLDHEISEHPITVTVRCRLNAKVIDQGEPQIIQRGIGGSDKVARIDARCSAGHNCRAIVE